MLSSPSNKQMDFKLTFETHCIMYYAHYSYFQYARDFPLLEKCECSGGVLVSSSLFSVPTIGHNSQGS